MPKGQHCINCRFWDEWDADDDDVDEGWCMRFPPILRQPDGRHDDEQYSQPITPGILWCGEWKPTDEAT